MLIDEMDRLSMGNGGTSGFLYICCTISKEGSVDDANNDNLWNR
jgi:hypothetical protein